MCKPNDREYSSVTSAAFSALSKFNRTHFKCSHLPEITQQNLKNRNKKLLSIEINKDKTIDELFPNGIPASCYFDICRSLDPIAYAGFKEFITTALADEIDNMPRRLQSNRETIVTEDDQQTIQRNFYELIKEYLNGEMKISLGELEQVRLGGSEEGIDNYLVNCYEAGAGGKTFGNKSVKLNSVKLWHEYEKTFRLLLTKVGYFIVEEFDFNIIIGI